MAWPFLLGSKMTDTTSEPFSINAPVGYESESGTQSQDECVPLSPDCVTQANETNRKSPSDQSTDGSRCSTISSKDTSSNSPVCRICHSSSGINKGGCTQVVAQGCILPFRFDKEGFDHTMQMQGNAKTCPSKLFGEMGSNGGHKKLRSTPAHTTREKFNP